MKDDDVILVCTDGVHDNLDPQTHGLSPSDIGGPSSSWTEVIAMRVATHSAQIDPAITTKLKEKFANEKLQQFYMETFAASGGSVTMEKLTEHVIRYCWQQTKSSRDFMEQYPTEVLPNDYRKFPGKMDHVSCICFRGQFTLATRIQPLTLAAKHQNMEDTTIERRQMKLYQPTNGLSHPYHFSGAYSSLLISNSAR